MNREHRPGGATQGPRPPQPAPSRPPGDTTYRPVNYGPMVIREGWHPDSNTRTNRQSRNR